MEVGSPEWIAERRTGIGGSMAAAVCDLSPWMTSYEAYLWYRGEAEKSEPDDPEAARWGLLLEDTIAKEYERRKNRITKKDNELLRSQDYPFMIADLDRHIIPELGDDPTPGVLEIKTASAFSKEWGEDGSSDVPLHYLLQVQHYLAVTEWKWADLVALIGGRDLRIYPIERDEELIENLIKVEGEFWQRVQEGRPPDINYEHQNALKVVRRLYPGTNGTTIDLPTEALHWAKVEREAADKAKEYGQIQNAARAHLQALMGESAIGRLQDGSGYVRKLIKKKGFTVEPTEYVDFRFKKNLKEKE